MRPDEVLAAIEKGSAVPVQERTSRALLILLGVMTNGGSYADAIRITGCARQTADNWRYRYQPFDQEVSRLIVLNAENRAQALEDKKWDEKEESGLVLAFDAESPPPGGLTEFRMTYFGRPTPIHQQAAVAALEDMTNLYVFIFGPTGMGKDTLAGDYAAWRLCPDTTGRRCGWIMKTGPKAVRRLKRLGRYMTDPVAIRDKPDRTPGGAKPSRSLITDYGPFKWEPGMVWEDGTEVHRPAWAADQMYFVRVTTPEQDPNWQAIGVEQSLYGDRIDEAVCSDIFDLENQKSPTERANQLRWVNGTFHSRLDEAGRMTMIGTWLPIEHNYEPLLKAYTADARVLKQVQYGPGVYTKYSNGVAVVIIKAIVVDPDTEREVSYWPEKFPLSDVLVSPGGNKRVTATDLTDEDHETYAVKGYTRERGLLSIRAKDPVMFKAMYQQERDPDVSYADFDDDTLDLAMDPGRSFGQIYGHEIRLIGVDPARRYGAGWVLLCVDKADKVITVSDFWWGERLGYTGIKEKLILKPLARHDPSWLCYEDNREGSVLGDTVIWKTINDSGVSLFTHTTGLERGSTEVGPGAIATWMRDGRFKIPAATAEDLQRASELRSHFKAWDANPDRSKPGRAGHNPDDLAMATWVAWLKAAPMIEGDLKDTGIIRGVPAAIRRRYNRATKERAAHESGNPLNPRDVLTRGDPLTMIRTFAEPDSDA